MVFKYMYVAMNISQVALLSCDDLSVGYDEPILKIKKDVEMIWQGSLSARGRKALATHLNLKGFNICADNVEKVFT